MKEITVISGKGGTGKTSITAALATSAKELILCDSDVDAPDLHLIMQPEILSVFGFEGNWVARIDQDLCTGCGICAEYCRFDAISFDEEKHWEIHPFKCEGCRLCERICPSSAIKSKRSTHNSWYVSRTRTGIMTHAKMGPGEENSGKLVTCVRQKARELAIKSQAKYLLTDGPPGTGCATIASVTGTDAVLVVMEPSLSSLHDADRVIKLVKEFNIPVLAVINKFDIHPEMTQRIEEFLDSSQVDLLGKIPFEDAMVKAMVQRKSIIEYDPDSRASLILAGIWEKLSETVHGKAHIS